MRYGRNRIFIVLTALIVIGAPILYKRTRPTVISVNVSEKKLEVKSDLVFPRGFVFGAATSAYQTEGESQNTDWYEWQVKQRGRPFTPAEIKSVDHYHRFREDFDLAKQIGLQSVRISIEWARIEPNCDGKFDEKEMKHYEEVVRAMTERGLAPFVNLNHFSLPICYAQSGGWLNPELPRFFARYAGYIARHLNGVEWWMTFNEPMVVVVDGYIKGDYPPGEKDQDDVAIGAAINMLEAHRRAYRVIHSIAKTRNQKVMVGMASFTPMYLPYSDSREDKRAAAAFNFAKRFFDVGSGGEQDYVGINYYSRHLMKFSILSTLFGSYMSQGDGEKNDMGWEIYPYGLYQVINEYRRFNKPIIVTENGLPDEKDTKRARFILEHLYWVHKAIEEGADVRGYFVWSLTDTYEWGHETMPRFGLVGIDLDHGLARSVRPGALVYGEVCRTKKITPELWQKAFEKK